MLAGRGERRKQEIHEHAVFVTVTVLGFFPGLIRDPS